MADTGAKHAEPVTVGKRLGFRTKLLSAVVEGACEELRAVVGPAGQLFEAGCVV